ncbi:MAG: glycosyl transferase, partial [Bacteroidetes bacterium]
LPESATLLRDARKVIAHDSGMMHLAAALRKEVLSIWGNTVPAFGMTPYFGNHPPPSHLFEVRGLPCRPCSKLGFARCPKGHFRCMREQDLNAIAARAAAEF